MERRGRNLVSFLSKDAFRNSDTLACVLAPVRVCFSFYLFCLFVIFLLITNWIGNREKEIIRIIIG